MTIKDIARRSGYAVGTVSRVLNGTPGVSAEARERILAVVRETGFQPNGNARHLKQRRSESIAIIVKGVGNMLFARVLEKMQSRIKAAGKAAAVYYLDENDNEVEQAVRICRELKPSGILFLGGNRGCFLDSFGQIDCPCVLVSNRADALGFPNLSSVATDDVDGAASAMGYLLDAGHRAVGVIGGESCVVSPELMCNTSQLRLTGCIQACARRAVPFDPVSQTVQSRFSMEGGYEGAQVLLDRMPELTAIFAMSDVMAIGAIRAVLDCGRRVPEDVSVMGFDGIEQSHYCTPRLTTIRQGADQMARRGVEILLAQLAGSQETVHEVVPFSLTLGESVSNVKGGIERQ